MQSPCLIDAGPLIAYFDASDDWHKPCTSFISSFRGQFTTTMPVVTEVMWLLRDDFRVQNEFLVFVERGLFRNENLTSADLTRIVELNAQYENADFADLSLVSIGERMGIEHVLTLDKDFDVYRRKSGHKFVPFKRFPLKK